MDWYFVSAIESSRKDGPTRDCVFDFVRSQKLGGVRMGASTEGVCASIHSLHFSWNETTSLRVEGVDKARQSFSDDEVFFGIVVCGN